MKRNPLIPFGMIAVLGIVLMLSLSVWGGGAAQERAAKENGTAVEDEANLASLPADEIFGQKCAACHGQNLEGVGGAPNLQKVGAKLSKKEILDQIANGGGIMPGGLITGEAADKVATWLSEKK